MNSTVFACLIVIGLILLIAGYNILYMYIQNKREKNLKAPDCMRLSYDKKSIIVSKRNAVFLKYITLVRYSYTQTKFHDAELVYTGATVGGVHTGGFHVNPATQTKGDRVMTDKYDLYLYPYEIYLNTIELESDALIDAQKDLFISQFLQGNKLVLSHKNNMTSLEGSIVRDSMTNPNASIQLKTAGDFFAKKRYAETKLTKDECKKIRDWLGNR